MVKLNLDFTPNLKELEDLTKKSWLTANLSGSYESIFKGSGREFEGFSVYTPEQDSKKIDWKASAKSEKVLMRDFVEERDLQVHIVMDCSSSLFFSSTKILKAEYVAELVNSIAFSVISAGDFLGLTMASATKNTHLPPSRGQTQYFRTITELARNENYGGKRSILVPLMNLFRSKDTGIVFIVSDFMNASDDELGIISLLTQKFEVYILVVRDPMEKILPADTNAVAIEDYESGRSIIVNLPQVREEYMLEMDKDEKRLEKFFLQHDIGYMKCYTHKPYLTTIMQFFEQKKNQWS